VNWPRAHTLKDICVKYIRYSAVGTIGFLISTIAYFLCADLLHVGWASWFLANIIGGIWAFLIFYFKVDIARSRDEQ